MSLFKRLFGKSKKKAAQDRIIKQENDSKPVKEPIKIDLTNELLEAIRLGNIKEVTSLLERGADPSKKNIVLQSPIFNALFFNSGEEMIKILVNAGANLNDTNNNGIPFLVSEAGHGELENVKLLLKYGADPNIKDKDGYCALGLAAVNGEARILEALILARADINSLHKDKPILYWAARHRHKDMVSLLLEKGANGQDALDKARLENNLDAIKILNEHRIKDEEENNVEEKEIKGFKDKRDGKVYKIVEFGDQTWLADNLKFDVRGESWHYNHNSANGSEYGKLYTKKGAELACPEGWRLPTIDDFSALITYIGENHEDVVGNLLTEFSVLFGGHYSRYSEEKQILFRSQPEIFGKIDSEGGAFNDLEWKAYFWSSTHSDVEGEARILYINKRYGTVVLSSLSNNHAYSVRLIKDDK